ncbi:hypothetical protein Kpol_1061p42 [Vanderwaltozyma polyspora DSM 70294]|uniref:Zn(2)-C6 fungal-type domain-containing protein n=1 Tax=Vanderwaltozyma polyspora (strain ATCC 22028 / DSM 70294 / BCRC 21397 / CBS 2163 / NBRC 10782 / NRRL Y-8283 / UCD 57-17) TaxID=436907 RepID=A7TJG7_VANPO|nr:uncharacterized protein Kpol_1061p42 [Vanderwaltozyma polyspora DSM 70294]EDO17617.1 hypothetical protein Kpol_1061p42 [Vanderwaltozyma polyspora DSM 70294]
MAGSNSSGNSSTNDSNNTTGTSNTNTTTQKKTRSKVSRACEGCRRRKIKCSGNWPCSSCITYDCECIFTSSDSINSKKKITSCSSLEILNKSKTLSENNNNNNNNDNNNNNNNNNIINNTSHNINNRSGSNSLDVSRSVSDTNLDSQLKKRNLDELISCDSKVKKPNSQRIADHSLGFFKVVKRKNVCQHTELNIPVDELPDFKLNNNDGGYFEDDSLLQKKLINLQNILKNLKEIKNLNNNDLSTNDLIENVNSQINEILNDWTPKINYKKLKNNTNLNPPKKDSNIHLQQRQNLTSSVETHLMKNRYTNRVNLTKYSIWSDQKENKANLCASFLSKQPLIEELFGLYSPFLGLSFRGIGSFYQREINNKCEESTLIQMKESIYILLRFFDLCIDHMTQSCITIGNPLENYLTKYKLLSPSSTTNTPASSPMQFNNKDSLTSIIKLLPQPFLYNLAGITTDQLLMNVDNYFFMFSLILKIFQTHKQSYEILMIRATNGEDKISMDQNPIKDMENFLFYSKQEELLLVLSYSYYNSTLYHYDDFKSLDYLEILLSLIDKQLWLDEYYAVEKVLEVTINYAMKMGLSRWEFYVGLSENEAERRRRDWWRLYAIEKLVSSERGMQSSIVNSRCNCLLIKEFRDVGFMDINEFLENVHLCNDNSYFNTLQINALLDYFNVARSIIIADFYENVLYHERYTSIKNNAKPTMFRIKLTTEVFNKLNTALMKLDVVQNQAKRLFKIAFKETSSDEYDSYLRYQVVYFVFAYFQTICIILHASSNLLARLIVLPAPHEFNLEIEKLHDITCLVWSKMNKLLTLIDDDYTVARCYKLYGIGCLLMFSRIFKSKISMDLSDTVNILKIVKRFQNSFIYNDLKNNEVIANSITNRHLNLSSAFVAVITHLNIVLIMKQQNLTKQKLIEKINKISPDVSEVIESLLDPKSYVFEYIMKNINESGFHLNVRRMFSDLNDVSNGSKKKFNNPRTAHFPKNLVESQEAIFRSHSPQNSQGQNVNSLDMLTSVSENANIMNYNSGYVNAANDNSVINMPRPSLLPNNSVLPSNDLLKQNGVLPDKVAITKDIASNPSIQQFPFLVENDNTGSYNLGTLDEFVNNGDLNDLYNTLWRDLYSVEYI